MATAEANHELGRKGVFAAKAWLESTTHLVMPWNVYDHTAYCTRQRLDGGVKRYDLKGQFIGQNQRPAVVEVKEYSTVGKQPAEFTEFLANAYSTTAYEIENSGDTKTEFIWVTTHPFSQSRWPKLTGRAELEKSLKTHHGWIGGDHKVDPDLVNIVTSRMWLLVRHARQAEISLTTPELYQIYPHLGRYPA